MTGLQSARSRVLLASLGRERLRRLAGALAFLLVAAGAFAQAQPNPLKPPDRSSPRAALQTFLDSTDAFSSFLAQDYLPTPTRAEFHHLIALGRKSLGSLDLSGLPPAARGKGSRAAALALYEVLNRIALPPYDQIPDAHTVATPPGGDAPRWVIPDTEIALVRMKSGPHAGEFLFSADTVARAHEFYERVRQLPYRRTVALPNLHEIVEMDGGWMIPHRSVQSLPASLRAPLAEQALWKWIGLVLVLAVAALVLSIVYRVSQLGSERNPFVQALAQFTMPASLLATAPAVAYFALIQINLIGSVGVAVEVAATVTMFLAGAWMSWRFAPVVAEAIIASPAIPPESIDAHLIRVTARLLGIIGSAGLLALGADRLGLPVYGIIAGLGVGGLAIALAAQPTIENLIGGMNLFADKPIRVGDLCEYGGERGWVEAIGIRSTRIRGLDRTLTTIPNAALAKMSIVNLTQRDRMLIRAVIGLRYETTREQLRYILVRLREMLLGHPRVHPDPARVRLIGFGASSLDVEIFAYVTTRDWQEFLGIREDVLLRVMEIIEQGGAAIAFPSRTLYLGSDRGPAGGSVEAAEAEVRAWREAGALPFPNFTPEQARALRGSVAYPPPGTPGAARDAGGEKP